MNNVIYGLFAVCIENMHANCEVFKYKSLRILYILVVCGIIIKHLKFYCRIILSFDNIDKSNGGANNSGSKEKKVIW